MKPIRILSLALMLGLAGMQGACSDDKSSSQATQHNQYVDDLYAIVKNVERDYSQGYLLRNATPNEKKSFEDTLYAIKVAALRLQKNPSDGDALSSLYIASQSYNSLAVLEVDSSQLDPLKNKLLETINVLATAQGKTFDHIERVLVDQLFIYDLEPFTVYTPSGKAGWVKANHEDLSYAAMITSSPLDSWLMSPEYDLTNVKNPSFVVKQALNTYGQALGSQFTVLVSANFAGNPQTATWDTIEIERMPSGIGFGVVESENVDLKKYEGQRIVIAFRNNTNSRNYSAWQLSEFKLEGYGTLNSTKLTLTGGAGSTAGGTATGGTTAPGTRESSKPAALACSGANAVAMFDRQFTDGTLGSDVKSFGSPTNFTSGGATYTGVIKASGYNSTTKGNNAGTTYLVTKDINLTGTKDACLSVSEDIFMGKGAPTTDLKQVQVLVSTDYAGDPTKATWKTVTLGTRKAETGLVNADILAPAASAGKLKDLVGDGAAKVTIGLKYTIASTDANVEQAPWWGVAGITVAAVPTGEIPITPVTNTPSVNTAPANPLTLDKIDGKTFESTCYKFGTATEYSKKYWSFANGAMSSLLLKYTDAACTAISKNADGSGKVWAVWTIGTLTATPLTGDWSVVGGTCTLGCTAAYKTALRLEGDTLNEGSAIKNTEKYNTDEGQYVVFAKMATPVNLTDLAASLSPVVAPVAPVTPAAPVAQPQTPAATPAATPEATPATEPAVTPAPVATPEATPATEPAVTPAPAASGTDTVPASAPAQ